jgi:hypothetical protein
MLVGALRVEWGVKRESRMKIKRIAKALFEPVFDHNGVPVLLTEGAVPNWARKINERLRCDFIASGERISIVRPSPNRVENGCRVGGMDFIRFDPHGPVPYKRDWYPVIEVQGDEEYFWTDGPIKEWDNHHLQALPQYYVKIEIIR